MLRLPFEITTPLARQLLLVLSLCWPLCASAARVPELYAAAVPVEDRSEEARLEAFRDVLAAVLVKVSGERRIVGEPDVYEVLEDAPALVLQYRYTDEDELWAAFDGPAVERRMRAAGLPVWGQDRPAVLLWLAVDWGGGRRGVVTAADDTELQRAIERVAASRGLPLILPLFDSADRELMSFSDLWGGFSDKIEAASARYAADATLVGRASRGAGSRLFVRWQLDFGSAGDQWQGGLSDGLHHAADRIAARFATRGAAAMTQTLVAVSGIGTFDDYGRVSAYFDNLTIVRALRVARVAGDTVVFGLELQGDPAQLARVVEVGQVLQPDTAGGPVAAQQYYRLVP